VGAPYGVKGWFHVQSFTQIPETILQYPKWWLSVPLPRAWEAFEVQDCRKHGKGLVAALNGVETREAAALLTGKEIAVGRELLPDLSEDEFYWSDLEGLAVYDPAGQLVGHIAYLYEAGASDILVIQGEREWHIPFVKGEVVQSVDLAARKITVDWVFD